MSSKNCFCRNNVGGPTTAIAGFCSYFFDADKQVLLDKLYDRPSGTTKELWSLPELTGNKLPSFMMCRLLYNEFINLDKAE